MGKAAGWHGHKWLILIFGVIAALVVASGLIIAGYPVAGELVADVTAWALALAAYCAPVLIARRRRVRNLGSITVLTVFGFLVFTWIAALAMACSSNTRPGGS